jgi:hypothetical protein
MLGPGRRLEDVDETKGDYPTAALTVLSPLGQIVCPHCTHVELWDLLRVPCSRGSIRSLAVSGSNRYTADLGDPPRWLSPHTSPITSHRPPTSCRALPAMTQHHPIFQTLLILQPIEPLSLLDQLRELFAVVHYYPLPPFQAVPLGAREPSPEVSACLDPLVSRPRASSVSRRDLQRSPAPIPRSLDLRADNLHPQEYAAADCIFSFTVPANLTSIAQTPRLKLFQALSAGYGHITSTPFVQNLPADHPLIIASASGIHVSAIGEHSIATTMMLFHKLHELVIIGHEERRWIKAVDRLGGHYVRELRGQTVGIIG